MKTRKTQTTVERIQGEMRRVQSARKDAVRVLRTQRMSNEERADFHQMLLESEAHLVDLGWQLVAAA